MFSCGLEFIQCKNKECAYILIEFKHLLITEFKAVPTSVLSAMRESKVKHMVCALW